MKLKPKPNQYDVTYSIRKDPGEWSSVRVTEDKLQLAIMQVMTNNDWQLECVALIASIHQNRYDINLPTD